MAATPENARDRALFVEAAARAFRILEAFGTAPQPLSLGELAGITGLGKSAVQRSVFTLLELGYVERDPQDRGYLPGRRLLDRSFDFLRSHPLVERATSVLLELRRNARERVDLSLFDDLSIVYAVRLQSKRETFTATLVGRRLPSFCATGGRAAMARLPDEAVEDILLRSQRRRLTPKTIIDPDAIWEKIREARRDGYAFAAEESLIGEVVVAAAVVDAAERPVGAVHIAGSLSEWTVDEFRARFAPLAAEAARAISG